MADRISTLPDEVLCYILSFLPTKLSVSTSVLSKRWKPLWRSVPALHFDYSYDEWRESSHPDFFLYICTFILSNLEQPIQRFCLRIFPFHNMSVVDEINSFVRAAVSGGRLQHLDLRLHYSSLIDMSSNLSCCKTLTVLKLHRVKLKTLPSADFPLLKVLHLHGVHILGDNHLQQILSACPNVEDLEVKNVSGDYETIGEFKQLPNLRRAVIDKDLVPLEVVDNVQFLDLKITVCQGKINDPIPVFHNLTCLEFTKTYSCYPKPTIYWYDVFKVMKHSPKLQNLCIDTGNFVGLPSIDDCPFLQCVPRCIYFNLKTCRLNNYTGTRWEFEFAKYIMENGRCLNDMIICCGTKQEVKKLDMMKELSSCSRLSSTSCALVAICGSQIEKPDIENSFLG